MKKLLCKLVVFLVCKFHLIWQIEYLVKWNDDGKEKDDIELRYIIASSLEEAIEKAEKCYREDDYTDFKFIAGGGAIIIKGTDELY